MSTETAPPGITPEAAGAWVAWLEAGAFLSRRHVVVSRLRQLQESEQFGTLPDELQKRIRDIVGAA